MEKNTKQKMFWGLSCYLRRLSFVVLTVGALFCMNVGVHGQEKAKVISMNVSDVSVLDALREVNRLCGNLVMFRTEDVAKEKAKVSVHARDLSVLDVVKQCIARTSLTCVERDGKVIVTFEGQRSLIIVGTVTDERKQPIPGATILVKGLTVGTATDTKGKYVLTLPRMDDFSLLFSFVGMETREVKYAGKDTINVVLVEDMKTLDDVVVTGYMNIDKGSYVGAVTTVRVDQIKIAGETSIDQMLQGVVPGMLVRMTSGQVGATPKIRVRGTSTLLGSQEPVWVVDGVIQRDPLPMGENSFSGDDDLRLIAANAISWLNPNDIETLTVLKDASATAIYGSKAANGVIVVTTKKGKPGNVTVSYSGGFTIGQKPTYGLYDRMNSQEMMQFSKEMYEERVSYTSSVLPVGYAKLISQLNNKEISHDEMEIEFRKMERMNTDWFDILFRNSFSHNHSLSVYGGSEKITNRTSFNYSESVGEARGNDMSTFSVSSNTIVKFSSKVQLSFLFNGSLRNVDGFAYNVSPFEYAYNTSRVIPLYNEDGTLFYHEKWGSGSTAINGKSCYSYNILNELDNTGNENRSKTLSTSADLSWNILPGLQFQSLFSYSLSSSEIKSWATERSYYITNMRGYEFGTVLANGAEEKATKLPWGGLLYTEDASSRNYTFRNGLVYDKTFNERHRMTLQLGIEATSEKMTGKNNKNYGYLRERGETFANVPFTYAISSNPSKQNELYEEMRSARKVINRNNNYLSEYFTGIYSFDNRYVVNFNARLDASNRFGQDPDKKFRPTWSVGVKWRLGNEPYTRNWNWFDTFDISASYGFQGNSVENVSPFLIAQDAGFDNWVKQYSLTIKSLPYDDLGWEKTKSWNFSVDLSFLTGRLNVLLNTFGKSSDVLSSRDVPAENGMLNSVVFGSKMENKGFELTVNVVPVRTKDFSWQFSVNTGKTRNKVSNNERVNTLDDFTNGNAIINEEAYSTFYSYEFDGLSDEDGRPLFTNLDIEPTTDYLAFLVKSGKIDPDFSGGFFTAFRYKNLRLQANFSMQFGGQGRLPDFYKTSTQFGLPTPEQNVSRKLLNRWKNPGDQTIYPSLPGRGNYRSVSIPTAPTTYYKYPYALYNMSDIRVADTDMIRCRQISLSYDFGGKVLKSVYLKYLSVGVSMANPFMITFDKKWKGIDPETGGWPARKTTSFSLSATF